MWVDCKIYATLSVPNWRLELALNIVVFYTSRHTLSGSGNFLGEENFFQNNLGGFSTPASLQGFKNFIFDVQSNGRVEILIERLQWKWISWRIVAEAQLKYSNSFWTEVYSVVFGSVKCCRTISTKDCRSESLITPDDWCLTPRIPYDWNQPF